MLIVGWDGLTSSTKDMLMPFQYMSAPCKSNRIVRLRFLESGPIPRSHELPASRIPHGPGIRE